MVNRTLQEWRSATKYFRAVVERIPEDRRKTPGVCGVWNAQQVIAHLAGWQREALKRYRDFQRGDSTNTTYDVDAFNTASIEALKLLNWRETLETYRYTCEDLDEMASRLTTQDLTDPRYEEWLIALARENHEHAIQIETWLATER
jgi:hypothetical protein